MSNGVNKWGERGAWGYSQLGLFNVIHHGATQYKNATTIYATTIYAAKKKSKKMEE